MKVLHKTVISIFFIVFLYNLFYIDSSAALSGSSSVEITNWEIMWDQVGDLTVQDVPTSENEWIEINYVDKYPVHPSGVHTVWIKFDLPELTWSVPVLSINKLYASKVKIYINQQNVFESNRDYSYDKNQFLLPLDRSASGQTVYIKLETSTERIGLQDKIIIGEYQVIAKEYMKKDLFDLILGAALFFISISMLVSMLFLNRTFIQGWSSLGTVIMSVGLMILTYSPFLHTNYSQYGRVSYYLFDVASTLLMPSLFFFIEKIFGRGPYSLITRFRKIQVVIAIISIFWLILSFKWDSVYEMYSYAAVFSFAGSVIIGNLLFICSLIVFCQKGNKDAIIMSAGLSIFAGIGGAELIWFYASGTLHIMFYWKFGILGFLISLVVILARRISRNYEQVVEYSKQLEVFNNDLQRSEKMEVISQLAASVAHEVRNPLQVTRGFLQLLGAKTNNSKDKSYMVLAIDELDRASEIITDFLTFAKPQPETTTVLNIKEELHQIEGILVPLATMQGGILNVEMSKDLYVRGNSTKLKQALINIIKNSIEALGEDGVIDIKAYEDPDEGQILVSIRDNGEGMHEEDLKRLGEPYYSKKSKGTGLGLMVTFRIIEVMQGKIVFKSKKDIGTEVVIYLPSVAQK
ncbi:ATP-binding protein [Paenibacillus paridis]|uniref:ATP-binding protein n=1 Tax=Paenibacillus paridis TaxID=2583376 RepID=UPI001120473F|nr:ATP-binding protein [Paenibacillus paridis]